jgi:two-component system sensor histidine kinase/response regulator
MDCAILLQEMETLRLIFPRRFYICCAAIVLWGLLHGLCMAQDATVDSLQQLLARTQDDTTRCNLLEQLSDASPSGEWQRYNTQLKHEALRLLRSAQDPTHQRFFLRKYALAVSNEGYDAINLGQLETALKRFNTSLALDQLTNSPANIAADHNNIGYYHQLKGDIPQALAHYQQALAIEERVGDAEGGGYTLINIAGLHEEYGQTAQAMQDYRECLAKFQAAGDPKGVGIAYNSIAHLHIEQAAWDSAQAYVNLALTALQPVQEYEALAAPHHYQGFIYYKTGNTAAALKEYEICVEMAELSGEVEGLALAYVELAEIHLSLNQPQVALDYGRKGLELALEIGTPKLIQDAAAQLGKLYRARKEYALALEMKDLEADMTDSLRTSANLKALMRTQFQYEYDQRVVADSLALVKDREIVALQLDRKTNQQRYLFAVLGLSLIFIGIVYQRFRVARRQKRLIETANRDLERQHLLNQKIFSVIAHDFRGPMLSLQLMLQSFKRRTSEPVLQEFVHHASDEVASANAILHNLLNWARTEINIQDWDQVAASVEAIAQEIARELDAKRQEKNISLQLHIPAGATMALPPDILRIALRNLLSNAIKYSFPGGTVTLTYAHADGMLQVRDHGMGIPAATLARLFRQEIDTLPGTAQEEGFGMGLYIVADLLHKYQHDIGATSHLGNGACFTIRRK